MPVLSSFGKVFRHGIIGALPLPSPSQSLSMAVSTRSVAGNPLIPDSLLPPVRVLRLPATCRKLGNCLAGAAESADASGRCKSSQRALPEQAATAGLVDLYIAVEDY